jgi:hypothetical protein
MSSRHQLFRRLEILFWTALIKIMSEAPGLSRLAIQARYRIRGSCLYRVMNRAVVWSLLGLALGFLLGVFSRFIS